MTSDARLELPMPISAGFFAEETGFLIVYEDWGSRRLRDLEVLAPPLPTTPKVHPQLGGRTTSFMFPAERANRRGLPLQFEHLRGGGRGERSSEEVGCVEARDQSSSRPLTTSVSKSTLELEGSGRGSIVGYSPSSSPPTSMPTAQVHVKLKVVQFR